ncbi:DEHA2B15664p [Debaryomyces hansenii CBS767]|uniref:DEHA2B15664p n=1 Tax=Debaryomyces hansenii (strain ATCC 36239 / CBS 767 / BCRC 21394 / JCM 1990 / NBRC 0083 / IGC 2968) TaxID=284592 RepID=Q6BVY8_DEBHA|nr:DEHA2B15664p [Debaryomyces hansenii CBS767]CAG85645.2 DEHA2B15664p [Debaryomyces hansenii CBS767]|eukprot:XP_457631.2 DEHA2B15664p [Debaryomyces hansenii CBS767]
MIRIIPGRYASVVCRKYAFSRFYSSNSPTPPQYKKGGNILANSLRYVRQVDEYQKQLEKAPSHNKVVELMDKIENQPELLFILATFHYELSRIGIGRSNDPKTRSKLLWKYRFNYILKYSKLHNIFWEQCRYANISQHTHVLGFNPQDIGLLDPCNFSEQTYNELQSGKYKDMAFKDVEIITFSRPPFK